jgi:hypothetical protein
MNCGVTGKLQKSSGARYNSKNHLGAKHLSLELLANSKYHLDLSITPKIMKKLGI